MRRPQRPALTSIAWLMMAGLCVGLPHAALAQRPPANIPPAKPQAAKPQTAKPKAGRLVPIPQPKPRVAGATAPRITAPPLPLPRPPEIAGPPQAATPSPNPPAAPPPPLDEATFTACLADLEARGGEATPQKQTDGQAEPMAACSIPGPVSLSRVRVPDGPTVALETAVTVRCTMALELASWIRDDLTAIAKRHGTAVTGVTGVGGYSCRMRNGQSDAPISEHASGNAFDLLGIKLADGRLISLAHADAATAEIRAEIQKSTCARFLTVLGPGADSSHADHVHLDMRQRRGGFRMCQWNVE